MPSNPSFSGFPAPTDLTSKIVLFRRKFPNTEIVLKPFHLLRDIKTIHRWVNMPYAKEFWQLAGSLEQLYVFYEQLLQSGKAYSLMAFLNSAPIAQIDYYDIRFDELKSLYNYEDNDHGIHLIMAPHQMSLPGLTPQVMITALSFLFSTGIPRIMGEPDAKNGRANQLVLKVGFSFIKQIKMSYKTANLYEYGKKAFLLAHS